MKSNPIGGIYGDKMAKKETYANVILQSLSALETTQEIFLKQNNPYIEQTFLTKQFLSLLNTIYNTLGDACSLELINLYLNYANNNNNALFQHPYNFLIYFLKFLEEEYNRAFNINNTIEKNASQDIDTNINSLKQYLELNKSSLFLNNYFFSILLNTKCEICGTVKYEWGIKKSIDLVIDEYKSRKNGPINMNESLKYYTSGKYINLTNSY